MVTRSTRLPEFRLLLKSLHWLPIYSHIKLKLNLLTYKALSMGNPLYLAIYLHLGPLTVIKKLRSFIICGCCTAIVESFASWYTWSKISHWLSEQNKNTTFYIWPSTLIWASTNSHMMNFFFQVWTSPPNTDFSPQHQWVSILLRNTGAIEVIISYYIL